MKGLLALQTLNKGWIQRFRISHSRYTFILLLFIVTYVSFVLILRAEKLSTKVARSAAAHVVNHHHTRVSKVSTVERTTIRVWKLTRVASGRLSGQRRPRASEVRALTIVTPRSHDGVTISHDISETTPKL